MKYPPYLTNNPLSTLIMPRDSALVEARNKDIRKAYERLIAEESIVMCRGIKAVSQHDLRNTAGHGGLCCDSNLQ